MGERTTYVYKDAEPTEAVFDSENTSIDSRKELFDRFAHTPMAYMVGGVPQHASGSYEALQLCEYLQNESLPLGFLEASFEDAVALAERIKDEEKPQENPDEENKDELIPDEPDAVEVVEQAAKAEPTVKHDKVIAEPVMEVAPTEPAVVGFAPDPARSVAYESAVELVDAQAGVAEAVNTEHQNTTQESAGESVVATATPAAEKTADSTSVPEMANEEVAKKHTIEQINDSHESEPQQGVVEITREELVTQAAQAVMDVFDEQAAQAEAYNAETVQAIEHEEAEELANSETIVVPPEEVMTVTETAENAPGEGDIEPLFEIPILEPFLEDDVENNGAALLGEEPVVVAEAEQGESDSPEADELVDHVRTLTAILQAEQAIETEPNETLVDADDGRHDSLEVEQTSPDSTVALNETVKMAAELAMTQELTATLEDIGIVAPEIVSMNNSSKIYEQTKTIIQKIETVETSTTAEECHAAVEALRNELEVLLALLGRPDAAIEAERLLRHWHHDMESLKRYMVALQKALIAAQTLTLQRTKVGSEPHHRHYGARAVRMVVRLITHSPASEQVIAA